MNFFLFENGEIEISIYQNKYVEFYVYWDMARSVQDIG